MVHLEKHLKFHQPFLQLFLTCLGEGEPDCRDKDRYKVSSQGKEHRLLSLHGQPATIPCFNVKEGFYGYADPSTRAALQNAPRCKLSLAGGAFKSTTKQYGLIPDGKGAKSRDFLVLCAFMPPWELLDLTVAIDMYATPALPDFEGKNLLTILTHPALVLINFGFKMEVLSAPIQELLQSSQVARVREQGQGKNTNLQVLVHALRKSRDRQEEPINEI